MLLKTSKITTFWLLLVLCVIQCEISACYKTEVEITPAPPEEATTKKPGFFKRWFGGGSSHTTADPLLEVTTAKPKTPLPAAPLPTAQTPAQNPSGPLGPSSNQRPPPLVISNAPLVPLGPRPDTPSTSPFGAGPPQWPQPNTNKAGGSSVSFGAGSPQVPQQTNANAAGSGSTSTTTSATAGKPQTPPQWPQPHPVGGVLSSTTTTTLKPAIQQNAHNVQNNLPRPGGVVPPNQLKTFGRPAQPNLPPGFSPYQPPKSQPSGLDLSYGGGFNARPQQGGKPGFGLAPMTTPATTSTSATTSTTSTTTTTTSRPQQLDFDLRGDFDSKKPGSPQGGKEDFPSLPAPRRPSIKEDFPALPVPKSPTPTPSSPSSPSSPSAWNKPLPTPAQVPGGSVTSTTVRTPGPKSPVAGGAATPNKNGVSFVPHSGTTTTVRPGFEKESNNVATDDEIRSLTETLYTKEVNSQLNLITVNTQGKTRSIDSTDEAPQPLLEIDSKALDSPTIAKMRLLFNNYEQDTLVNEFVTPIERKEENDFVDAVMATSVMRQAMLFLQNKGIVSPDPKTHRDLVKELWFTQYSRGSGKIGSSGFEHVFVNEVKNGTIIGLHNWVYFHDEEKAGHLDYKGYLNQLDLGTKGKVLKVRFTHNGLNKPVNTLFIGTSPELELALYTVCFKLRPDRTCPVSLGNNKFGIVTYSWRYRGKSLIGSAYPEI
ncbi:endoribonuclease Arlr [Cochliomyia hominivorax]